MGFGDSSVSKVGSRTKADSDRRKQNAPWPILARVIAETGSRLTDALDRHDRLALAQASRDLRESVLQHPNDDAIRKIRMAQVLADVKSETNRVRGRVRPLQTWKFEEQCLALAWHPTRDAIYVRTSREADGSNGSRIDSLRMYRLGHLAPVWNVELRWCHANLLSRRWKSLACSPDGRWIAASIMSKVSLRDCATGALVIEIAAESSCVGFDWSASSKGLAVASLTGKTKVYATDVWRERISFEVPPGCSEAWDWMHHGETMVYQAAAGKCMVADVNGEPAPLLRSHNAFSAMAWCPDDTSVATLDLARKLKLTKYPEGQTVWATSVGSASEWSFDLMWSPGAQYLAIKMCPKPGLDLSERSIRHHLYRADGGAAVEVFDSRSRVVWADWHQRGTHYLGCTRDRHLRRMSEQIESWTPETGHRTLGACDFSVAAAGQYASCIAMSNFLENSQNARISFLFYSEAGWVDGAWTSEEVDNQFLSLAWRPSSDDFIAMATPHEVQVLTFRPQ